LLTFRRSRLLSSIHVSALHNQSTRSGLDAIASPKQQQNGQRMDFIDSQQQTRPIRQLAVEHPKAPLEPATNLTTAIYQTMEQSSRAICHGSRSCPDHVVVRIEQEQLSAAS
jgi:hypothetical protein